MWYMAQIYRNIKENGKPMQDFTRALIRLYTLPMCMYLEIFFFSWFAQNFRLLEDSVKMKPKLPRCTLVCEEDLSF